MILYNFASRSRPEKFFQCLDNIHIHARQDKFLILANLDEDDTSMFNDEVKRRLLSYPNVYPIWGHSENKIHAINRGMLHAPEEWDIVINVSDDILFIEEGFDDIVYDNMRQHFPDFDGVLHYPDQNQGKNCMTVSIIGRKYYERDSFIYNEKFHSLWCDIVAQEVAQSRGKYKFINLRLFDHRHPSFGQCDYDEQYKKTEGWDVRQRDYATYLELKKEYDPEGVFPIRSI